MKKSKVTDKSAEGQQGKKNSKFNIVKHLSSTNSQHMEEIHHLPDAR